MQSLEGRLAELTVEGDLYRSIDKPDFIQCFACAHRCKIKSGNSGICRIRSNVENKLIVPFGYVAALACDPIEKKPFFHAYPRTMALSFGMLGCDFHCGYCQNWLTSQALRDPNSSGEPRIITPERLVSEALRYRARVVTSTYNEPLITSEWAMAVFKEAKKAGLATSYVSNGNATPEVLDYIRPYTDLYKIDLKSFQDRNYRSLGGTLEAVLQTIKGVYARKMWLEIVTLTVPGFNDSTEELTEIARFLADVSPDIPWHVTGFHKDYKMIDQDDTPSATLIRAVKIGEEQGLRYVYAGNRPGTVGEYENTRCSNCKKTLIERHSFAVNKYRITDDNRCPDCGTTIAGIWERPNERKADFPLPMF